MRGNLGVGVRVSCVPVRLGSGERAVECGNNGNYSFSHNPTLASTLASFQCVLSIKLRILNEQETFLQLQKII